MLKLTKKQIIEACEPELRMQDKEASIGRIINKLELKSIENENSWNGEDDGEATPSSESGA